MIFAVKLCLLCAGLFLWVGLLTGILKYKAMMVSENQRAPIYIDVAHRAALMYSFAALVMAQLLIYSPYSATFQLWIAAVPLFFFAVSIATYIKLGLQGQTRSQFSDKNFTTTWGMWALIVGEVGGVSMIVLGFVQTQFV